MIRNIIFDLGGVLWHVDLGRSEAAFRALQPKAGEYPKVEYNYSDAALNAFDQYEMGNLADGVFREALRGEFHVQASDDEIDAAWNAMIDQGPITTSIAILKQVRRTHRVFLLSNTNSIHIDYVRNLCPELMPLFEKPYLSYELHMRKPALDIFQRVLRDTGADPSETVFIDDSYPNIEGAAAAGLRTIHLERPETLGRDLAEL